MIAHNTDLCAPEFSFFCFFLCRFNQQSKMQLFYSQLPLLSFYMLSHSFHAGATFFPQLCQQTIVVLLPGKFFEMRDKLMPILQKENTACIMLESKNPSKIVYVLKEYFYNSYI